MFHVKRELSALPRYPHSELKFIERKVLRRMKYNPYSNTGRRIAALTLSLALALPLAGCSKDEKDPAASKSGTDASTSTSTSTPDQSQQKEELNFAKYNTYLDMMNRVYELAGQDENFTADGKVVVQDVEGFVAACEQIKEDANKMLTALEDKDQRAKVKGLDYKSESSKDWSYQHYKSYKANGERVISTMDKLIELARAGGDINQQMTSLGNDHEKFIDNYNDYIVN